MTKHSHRTDHGLNRRQVLQRLGLGTAAAFAGSGIAWALEPAAAGRRESAADALAQFPLADVQLADGPFLRAQGLDERYLLSLEPDRLLHGFLVNAGLTPKAPVYGGWESEEPWVEIRCHGHTLGHYLSACSLMHASSGNPVFKERVDYIVEELHRCQEAGDTDLLCAFPDGAAQLENSVRGEPVSGVPWYTVHKTFAGLRDAHQLAGNERARQVLVKLTDWAWHFTSHMSAAQFEHMLDREHGGMNEILADVYALTGEPRHLDLARKFCHRALLDPLVAGRDTLDGLHANTQIPKVIGFQRLYELTGEADYRRAAEFFWRTVVGRRAFVTGGVGDAELFFPPGEFASRLSSAKTMETCCAYNLLRLTRALFRHDPAARYADYYERALYNSILASQDPDSGMMTYFQPTRPGYLKLYNTPTRSFWCCTGTGMESHAKYRDSLYFHDAHSLYVNLFVPSTVSWRDKGVTVRQITRFPESDRTRLEVETRRPTRFAVKLRHPRWCDTATVMVNGTRHTVSRAPGSYIDLQRTWRSGDAIEVHLPMKPYTEELPGDPTTLAVLYGPLVLAGRLGREGIEPGADIIVNERTYGDVLNAKVFVPAWLGDPGTLASSIVARATPLNFRAAGFAGSREMELVPYHSIAHERYTLYWKVPS